MDNCKAGTKHMMTSQQNFTQILSIDEIIIIFKFLDFENQLRLSRVNSQLKTIFKSYIWKQEYASLKVYKNLPNIVITNEQCDNWLCLKPKEYEEFLQTYADDVLYLTFQNSELSFETMEHDVDLDYFKNLLIFKYEKDTMELDDVKVIAARNTNLQELTLNSDTIVYETDELMECIILKMLNLKRLRIETDEYFTIKLSQFQGILSKSKLESLKLNAVIVWDEGVTESEKAVTMPIGLNEFSLHTTYESQEWPSGFTSYFRNFKSLTALTISLNLTNEILATIAETCNRLKKMRFEYSCLSGVKLFRVPFSVMEFSLLSCRGLSYKNLNQMLSLYNITKFDSEYTKYTGEFEDFHILPHIEALHITDDFSTFKFESAYKANENLKELTWYDALFPMLCITPPFPLKHCINLHTLNLVGCQMNLDTLLELRSLCKLELPVPLLQWPLITQLLLQHPSLRELIIRKYEYDDEEYPRMDLPAPNVGFATKVCSLEIPLDMLVSALDFWIDLFARNKSMKIIGWGYQTDEYERFGEAIKDIVNHRSFPKSMKTIAICGLHTDCKFILNHYEDYLKRLEIQTKTFTNMDNYDSNRYYWYQCQSFSNVKHYYSNRITLYRK